MTIASTAWTISLKIIGGLWQFNILNYAFIALKQDEKYIPTSLSFISYTLYLIQNVYRILILVLEYTQIDADTSWCIK